MPSKSKKPPQCSEIIPELVVHVGSEMVKIADPVRVPVMVEGKERQRVVEADRYERKIITETIPEHQCEEPATSLERDLEEVDLPGIHGTSMKIVEERAKCTAHARMGTIKNLDGSTGSHAIMSIADATEALKA